MDPLSLFIALAFGFLARQFSLPPLVGFLLAGFFLQATGVHAGDALKEIADLGVSLLLFTIGLKLRLRNLVAPEVCVLATIHLSLMVAILTLIIMLAGYIGIAWLGSVSWLSAALVAFALAFSSTVFAVKILEDRGEMKTRHGQLTIGILIVQDLIAVLFLTLASGSLPTLWAIGLLALPLFRPLLNQFLKRSGHGEVLVLFGIFMAVGGGQLFELVGIKAGLGALLFGVLLSGQSKTGELASALMSFKDVFLVGFFLTVGLNGLPNMTDFMIAMGIVICLLPIKSLMYFMLMVVFRLRGRTAFLATNDLSNYSEFGLIVAAVAMSAGWLSSQWLMIIAMALAMSFIAASIFNTKIHFLYAYFERYFHWIETKKPLEIDRPAELGDTEILILGMGRVGRGAYESMNRTFPDKVSGLDADSANAEAHQQRGYRMLFADAEDFDFWHRADMTRLRLIMMSLPTLSDMRQAMEYINASDYQGKVAAVIRYEDDREELEALGVDSIFDIYAESGIGYAEHVKQQLS